LLPIYKKLVPLEGVEPRLQDRQSSVLPLDDRAINFFLKLIAVGTRTVQFELSHIELDNIFGLSVHLIYTVLPHICR